jgi:hypothetical protein
LKLQRKRRAKKDVAKSAKAQHPLLNTWEGMATVLATIIMTTVIMTMALVMQEEAIQGVVEVESDDIQPI